MPHTLKVADGEVRTISPTTTVKLAERMLVAARIAKENLPTGFGSGTLLNILLAMYIAEESAHYLRLTELGVQDGSHPRVTERWIAALVEEGLVCVRIDHAALTSEGHAKVTYLIEQVFAAQRALD